MLLILSGPLMLVEFLGRWVRALLVTLIVVALSVGFFSFSITRGSLKQQITTGVTDAESGSIHVDEVTNITVKTSDWWEVTHPYMETFEGHHRDPRVRTYLRRYDYLNNPHHSCYQYRAVNVSVAHNHTLIQQNKFCYPSLIISGMPKCSTSALYQLLRYFHRMRTMQVKEECVVHYKHVALYDYFEALAHVPNNGSLTSAHTVFTACIDLEGNLIMREILHHPKTMYLLVVRDYPDWLWSSYNYWYLCFLSLFSLSLFKCYLYISCMYKQVQRCS